MSIKMIFAQSSNGVIGANGTIPWNVPDDMKEFKEKTTGGVVVMGRKTWDSLPSQHRPLKGRKNVVATFDSVFAGEIITKYDSVMATPCVNDAIMYLKHRTPRDIWVIGGRAIYDTTLPIVDELHITTIMIEVEGDVLAPIIDFNQFDLIEQSRIKYDTKTGTPFYTSIYKRK